MIAIGYICGQREVIARDPYHRNRVICRCSCGSISAVLVRGLLPGASKSCGCNINKKPKYPYRWSEVLQQYLPDKP